MVPTVYREFKRYESGDVHLADTDPFEFSEVDDATTNLLIKTWNTYGGFAAWRLRNMTHSEAPWRGTFDVGRRDSVIPIDSMREYFSARTQVS